MIKNLDSLPFYLDILQSEDEKDLYKYSKLFHKALWSENENLDKVVNEIFQECNIKVTRYDYEKRYIDILKVIICNLISVYNTDKKYVAISLDKNNYNIKKRIKNKEPIEVSFRIFEKLIELLANNNYTDLFKSENNPSIKISSMILLKNKLLELLNKYDIKPKDVFIHNDYEFISLKINKKLVNFEHTEDTIYRQKILKRYNEFLNTQDITIDNSIISYPTAVESIFTNTLSSNGRIFRGDWMHCKSELRSTIKINGKKTTEIDIVNCAIRLVSHLNNYNTSEKDLYLINNIDRDLVKRVTNIMLNVNNKRINSGIETVAKTIFNEDTQILSKKEKSKINIIEENKENFSILKNYGFSYTFSELKAKVKEIYNHYKTFANNYLFKGKGLELQFIDSKICFKVIEKFLDLNKVVLTIHDSFITIEEDKELLKKVVEDSYYELVNHYPILK